MIDPPWRTDLNPQRFELNQDVDNTESSILDTGRISSENRRTNPMSQPADHLFSYLGDDRSLIIKISYIRTVQSVGISLPISTSGLRCLTGLQWN